MSIYSILDTLVWVLGSCIVLLLVYYISVEVADRIKKRRGKK